MADALGSLVVSLIAETVQFNESLTRAAYHTSQTMGRIASSLDGVTRGFQLLETVASAVVFSEVTRGLSDFVTSAVKAQASLVDLGAKAGVTASQMSALQPAATMSGTSMDTVAQAATMLDKNLSGVGNSSKRTQDAMAALGFSAQDSARFLQSPAQALFEIAQRLDKFQDDGNKTAIVMALLGRSGAEMLPYLKQLGQQYELNSTVTNQQAAAAHALADQYSALQVQSDELRNSIATGLVPALSSTLTAFTDAFGGADGLRQKIVDLSDNGDLTRWALEGARDVAVLGESLTVVGGIIRGLVSDLKVLYDAGAQSVQGLRGLMALVAEGPSSNAFKSAMDGIRDANAKLTADVKADNEAWTAAFDSHYTTVSDALNKEIAQLQRTHEILQQYAGQDFGDQVSRHPERGLSHLSGLGGGGAADKTFENAIKQLEAEAAKAQIALAQAFDPKPMVEAAQQLELFAESPDWHKLSAQQQTLYLQKAAIVIANQMEAASDKDLLAMYQQIASENAKTIDGMLASADSIKSQTDQLNDQAKTMGMTASQLDEYRASQIALTLAREQDIQAQMEQSGNATDAELAAHQKIIDALKAQLDAANKVTHAQNALDASAAMEAAAKRAEQAWQQAANSIENDLITAFDDWAHGAHNLGQQLRDDLLRMFDTLVLRPILQPIAGDIASLFMSGAPSGSGVLSNASSFAGLFGGGGGIAGAADSFYSLFGLGSNAFTSGLADISIAASAGVSAVGGLGSFLAGALPVLGPAAAITALFASGLFDHHGGPKTGGFGETGTDYGRFFTPNANDSSMTTLANTTLSSFNQLLTSLGGTGSANFAFGFDEDPQGTANSRVSAGATVNGKRVFDVRDLDAGRGDKGVQTDLQLEAQRAILAALQASNLPADIAHILDSVTPSAATLAQVQQVEELAQAYGDMAKELTANPLQDALSAITLQAQGAYGAFQQQGTVFDQLMSTYDGSTQATAALDKASQSYYQSLVALMAQIQQVKQSIDTMFGDTIRNFRLGALDNQGKYAFYQADATSVLAQIQKATDPTIIASLEKQYNDDLTAAFNLLDSSQRSGLLDRYIAAANAGDAAGNTRLTQLGANASTDFNKNITDAQKAISDAADKLAKAADTVLAAANTQSTAANTALRAAQTPVTLNVNVGSTATEVNIG